jgi:hypothetical protein
MTPKEKAWNLYHTYRTLEGKFGDKVLYNYSAKQCALITVNEVILANPHSNPLNTDVYSTMDYWQEVKQEIEKL